MAKKTKLYMVGYGQNRGEPNVDYDVDLFNLPYDKATPDDPLVIFFGKDEENVVDMGKCKNRTWPDFRNVCIAGALDCQDFAIDTNTVLPMCFDKLICRHSINDLGVLIGLLPADFMTAPEPTIVVRTAILNNVKGDKDGALATARRFMEMYPNVVVTDEKKLVLSEIIAEYDRAKSKTAVQAFDTVSVQKSAQKNADPIKDGNWLSTDEMVVRCMDASPVVAGLDTDQIARYIQMARSAKAGLGLKMSKCTRAEDGATITCVHISEIQRVAEYIQRIVSDAAAAATKKSAAPKASKKPMPNQDKIAPKQHRYFIDQHEVKPVKIKKYISKNVFGEIKAACSKNTPLLLTILNDINVINIVPTDTNGNKVYYIQDNKVETSASLEFKNVNCLAQGFETRKSRQRIIWGISGNRFVCEKFFPTHDSRDKAYQSYIRNLSLDASELDLSEYLYVPDLIAELSAGKETVTEHVDEPVTQTLDVPSRVIAQRSVADKSTPTSPVVEASTAPESAAGESAEPVAKQKKRGRPRIIRTTHEPTRMRPNTSAKQQSDVAPATSDVNDTQSEPACSVQSSVPVTTMTSVTSDEPVTPNTSESNVMWAELYAVHGKYQERMNVLNTTQAALIRQLSHEQDTYALLMTTKNLQYILEQKQECEHAIHKMREMNNALKKLQKMLDEHKI